MLQYHFHWKTLSAIAGVTVWRFYFRLYEGTIRKEEVVAFLRHLRRHVRRKLLIIWDHLNQHRSRLVKDYVASQRGAIELEYLPAYAPYRSSTSGATGRSTSCRTSAPRISSSSAPPAAQRFVPCVAGRS